MSKRTARKNRGKGRSDEHCLQCESSYNNHRRLKMGPPSRLVLVIVDVMWSGLNVNVRDVEFLDSP
jgi:hypothetical protein